MTSFSFNSVIDVSGGSKPLTFTAAGADDASGIADLIIYFSKPISYAFNPTGSPSSFSLFIADGSYPDTWTDGQTATTFTISPFNAPGVYTIDHVSLSDHVGNTHTYSAADLSSLGSATSLVITDVEPAGSFLIDDVTVTEGDSGTKVATFTVTRSGGTAAFAVNFSTFNGSATTADNDYAANSGTLNFGAGVNTQTISVTIKGDIKFEPDQTFTVNLSGATNGATISDSQGVGTIANDDVNNAPQITLVKGPNVTTPIPGRVLSASELFTASDLDNDR